MTAEKVIATAAKELGAKESPANSNRTKYGEWYKWNGVAWCMIFVQWVFAQVGVKLPMRTASCGELMQAAKSAGCWVVRDFQPGDVVIYDFSGKQKTPEHCGIVEMELPDYGVQAIEGNTSQSGSQSNGGMVCRKSRATKYIIGAVRPKFQKEIKRMDNTPAPAHKEDVEWAVKNKILIGGENGDLMLSQPLTRQQFCTMLHRFAKVIGKA